MNFAKLTENGDAIWINAKAIVAVTSSIFPDVKAVVFTSDGKMFRVDETPEEVLTKVGG